MKRQLARMLIQDMKLKKGEKFMVGSGNDAWMAVYLGFRRRGGRLFDAFKPVRKAEK